MGGRKDEDNPLTPNTCTYSQQSQSWVFCHYIPEIDLNSQNSSYFITKSSSLFKKAICHVLNWKCCLICWDIKTSWFQKVCRVTAVMSCLLQRHIVIQRRARNRENKTKGRSPSQELRNTENKRDLLLNLSLLTPSVAANI